MSPAPDGFEDRVKEAACRLTAFLNSDIDAHGATLNEHIPALTWMLASLWVDTENATREDAIRFFSLVYDSIIKGDKDVVNH